MQLSPRRERRVGELGELGEVDIFDGHETYSLTDIGIDSYEDAIKINDKKSYWIASLFDVEAGKYFNFTTPNSVMLPITTSHKFRKINVEELLRLNLGREIGIEFDEDSIPDDLDARLHDLRFKVGIAYLLISSKKFFFFAKLNKYSKSFDDLILSIVNSILFFIF